MLSRTALLFVLQAVIVISLLNNVTAFSFGGFNLNFGAKTTVIPVEASKEFLSLNGVQIQSVSTGAFTDCGKLLNVKSKGPTLLVVSRLFR
jgi:hypothetical protein